MSEQAKCCLKLTPETKSVIDVEFKLGFYEYSQTDPPRWKVYKRDNYTIQFTYNGSYDNVYHDRLQWNEDASYEDTWTYDPETRSQSVTTTQTGGSKSSHFNAWTDDGAISSYGDLHLGDKYAIEYNPSNGQGYAFGPFTNLNYSSYFHDTTYNYWWSYFEYPWTAEGTTTPTTSHSTSSGNHVSTTFDESWDYTRSDTLSDLHSTAEMEDRGRANLATDPVDGEWITGNSSSPSSYSYVADRFLQDDETFVELVKGAYRMKFQGKAGVEYELKWTERFLQADSQTYLPIEGAPVTDSVVTEKVVATGRPQYTRVHYVDPPRANGYIVVVPPIMEGCSQCKAGEGTSQNSSVDFSLGLGRTRDGASAGTLYIDEPVPTNTLSTLSALRHDVSPDVLFNYDWTTFQIRQVVAPEVIADINVLSDFAYEISLYHPADFADLQTGPTGDPFAVWRVENPDTTGTNFNQLNIVETADGNTVTNAYVWSETDQGWTLVSGNGLRKESKSVAAEAATGDEIETVVIRDQQDQIVYVENRRFHTYDDPLGRALLATTVDPQGAARTTTYQYFTNLVADGTNYGKMKSIVHDTGAWTRYEYNSAGQLTKEICGFLNAALDASDDSCRVIEYDYSPVDAADAGDLDPTTPRTTIEKLLAREISRRYTVVLPGERHEIQCVVPGAGISDSNNLVTITKSYNEGDDRVLGKTRLTIFPDGTREVNIYEYFDNPSGSYVTNTVLRGEPDPNNEMNVLDGTRTVIVTTDTDHPVSITVFDIASSLLTSMEIYSDFDAFGRPQRTTYLDGTHTDTSYSCCGVDTVIDRDGTALSYEYDALKRRTAEHRFVSPTDAISLASSYDPQGNLLSTTRIGTNGSTMSLSTSIYNSAGELMSATDALSQNTSYTNYFDGAGQTVKVATAPDGSTRIETYAKEGSLLKLTGTAAHPVRYDYGVEQDGGVYRSYSKEIRLDANGNDTSEWTKTYTDALGRAYKTVYSDNASRQSIFNNKGQLTAQVDPDGVTVLYQYNNRSERTYTAVDMNANGIIDLGGTDRVTFATNDVVFDNGANVRRARTYVWRTDNSNSSSLLSTVETSVDGLQSWSTLWNNGTPVTSHSETYYDPANASRTVTNATPDGSYTVTTSQYGRLIANKQYDALNNQLSAISYSYDPHGRANAVTDARTGTTTRYFNNADQISGMVTPSPDGVQTPQVTTNYFDNMGRNWKTILPDVTSVTNEFFLSGELKKTYGSRTYPVEYTYDAQGRMKTMKTWQNFAGNSGAAVTTWNYDGYRGFLTNKVYAGGGPGPSYLYKPSGRLQTRSWARGISTSYGYNNAGELQTVDYADSTPDVTYAYNRLGRPQSVTQGSNICSYAFNDAGQLLSESTSGGTLAGLSLTNSYDALLRRASLSLFANSQLLSSNAYAFDAGSRLQIVSDGLNSATYSYLANSPLVQDIVFQQNGTNRMVTTKSYDSLNRPQLISSVPSASGQLPISFAYAYNAANQRTAITNADNSRWVYQYDALGQVVSGKKYWADGTPVAGQQFEYGFDDIGNRTSSKAGGDQSGAGLRPASYVSSLLNQHTTRTVPGAVEILGSATNTATVTVNNQPVYRKGDYFRDELSADNTAAAVWLGVTNLAVLNNGTNPDIIATNIGNAFVPKTPETFGYDADGNTTNDGRWTFTWDGENRLVSMQGLSTVPSGAKKKLDFTYDYQGRRIQKIGSAWNGSAYVAQSTNKFVYDGWNLVAELNGSNGLLRTYMWGLDVSGGIQGAGGVGGLVAIKPTGTNALFVAYDGNGNVTGLIDATTGTTSGQFEYGPFGEVIRASGPLARTNPFRFSTKYQDDESDFLYYGFRYYNPSTGRWLSRDPIGELGGPNLYEFVGNASISFQDYLGLTDYDHLPSVGKGYWTGNPGESPFQFFPDNPLSKTYPNGVPFVNGTPDYKGLPGVHEVVVVDKFTGDGAYELDQAEKFMQQKYGGKWDKPKETQWHHFDNNGDLEMQLVDKALHQGTHHSGPRSIIRAKEAAKNLLKKCRVKGKGLKALAVLGNLLLIASQANADQELVQDFKANYELYSACLSGNCGSVDQSEVENNLVVNVNDLFGHEVATAVFGKLPK